MSPNHSTPNQTTIMIHAELSTEARATLHRMRRNTTISSIVIAFLTLTLLLMILGYFGIKTLIEPPKQNFYYFDTNIIDPPASKPIYHYSQQKPSAPAASAKTLLYVKSDAPVAIPIPDIEVTDPSNGIGSGDNFGSGWNGDGASSGEGFGGGGGGFGSSAPNAKGLRGTLVDFKKKPSGSPVKDYDVRNPTHFIEAPLRLQRADFSESSLRRHFQAPQNLVLNHLAIGYAQADTGPKNFGAENDIKPSGWFAHYRGTVKAARSGTYRLHGRGDDYLSVYIGGKAKLHGHWPDCFERYVGTWKGSESAQPGPFGNTLIIGDWFTVKEGDTMEIDIAIGERPGGKVGFVLQIEEQGQTYRTDKQGRSILPLFQLAPISTEEQERIKKDFGNYEFDWDNIPYFPIAR